MTPKYSDYRQNFINEAKKANCKISSVAIGEVGPNGENLFQDYAYIDQQKKITTIILSGLHGAEGYIGSEIQVEILRKLSVSELSTNLLFVHAVNPYGMAWYRRTNKNNVDLNRNAAFYTKKIENKKFSIFLPFLSSSSYFALLAQWPIALVKALALGARDTSQVIASGQYEYQKSIFFGGFETQKEVSLLISNIQTHCPNSEIFRVIDIHTGLGPSAFDSLLVSGDSKAEIEYFKQSKLAEFIVKSGLIVDGKITKDKEEEFILINGNKFSEEKSRL